MKKTSKKTIIETETFCDVCNSGPLACSFICQICKRDICENCSEEESRTILGIYCCDCWAIGKSFREEIKEIEEVARNRKKEIKKQWEEKALMKQWKEASEKEWARHLAKEGNL